MTTYFVGGETDSFELSDNQFITNNTSGSQTNYGRGSIRFTSLGSTMNAHLINSAGVRAAATGNIWVRGTFYATNPSNPSVASFEFFNSVGQNYLRLYRDTGSTIVLQMWNGTAWVNVGNSFQVLSNNAWRTFDIHLNIAEAGVIEVYVDEGRTVRSEMDTRVFVDLRYVRFGMFLSLNSNDVSNYRNIIIADYSTIGHQLRRRAPTGNGANTAWDGDYTAVDEFPLSDVDVITTGTVGALETFTAGTLAATASGNVIKAVAVTARGRADDTSAAKTVKGVIVLGGTPYEKPMGAPYTPSVDGRIAIWDANPATSQTWDIASVNSEFGVKSET